MRVTIPTKPGHYGSYINVQTYEISDFCPVCGRKRGRVFGTLSYDGSRRVNVDGWKNPCGHIDKYSDVRKEGKKVAFQDPTPYGEFRPLRTMKDYLVKGFNPGSGPAPYPPFVVPAGTRVSHMTAMGEDPNYHFVDEFEWVKKSSIAEWCHNWDFVISDMKTYGIDIPKEYVQ
jgi:hypothetical protein